MPNTVITNFPITVYGRKSMATPFQKAVVEYSKGLNGTSQIRKNLLILHLKRNLWLWWWGLYWPGQKRSRPYISSAEPQFSNGKSIYSRKRAWIRLLWFFITPALYKAGQSLNRESQWNYTKHLKGDWKIMDGKKICRGLPLRVRPLGDDVRALALWC